MNKKILITGGAGYIGPKLVQKMLDLGNDVVVVDNLKGGYKTNLNKKAKFYKTSILGKKIYQIFKTEKPDIVFHLAALKSVKESLKDPLKFATENVLGSLNVIETMQKLNINNLVFFSTSGVYGDFVPNGGQVETQQENPSSPYACSKLAIEKYIQYYNSIGLNGIVLRFANVYGLGGKSQIVGAINKFINQIKSGEKIIIDGNGKQTRDFIYIDDLIDLCAKISNCNFSKAVKSSFVYNVSTGHETSINQIVKTITQSLNKKIKVVYDQKATIGQKRSVLNPSLSESVFKWKATTQLSKGIQNIL